MPYYKRNILSEKKQILYCSIKHRFLTWANLLEYLCNITKEIFWVVKYCTVPSNTGFLTPPSTWPVSCKTRRIWNEWNSINIRRGFRVSLRVVLIHSWLPNLWMIESLLPAGTVTVTFSCIFASFAIDHLWEVSAISLLYVEIFTSVQKHLHMEGNSKIRNHPPMSNIRQHSIPNRE